MVVDLLFASSGIEPEIVTAADPVEVMPGLRVPVAQTGHLIALKVLARDDDRRPQDQVDLLALIAGADDEAMRTASGVDARDGAGIRPGTRSPGPARRRGQSTRAA